MYSSKSINLRSQFRSHLEKAYPGKNAGEIYSALLPNGQAYLLFSDLENLCLDAQIPVEKINDIFHPYISRKNMISGSQFEQFFKDEFTTGSNQPDVPEGVSNETVLVLRAFATAIRLRLSPHPSERWAKLIQRNPPSAGSSKLRVATLCRLCNEYNLPCDTEDFIDALFEFLGTKTDAIDFQQFNSIMGTFA
ncbi:hypothetical protein TVAG_092790 [Trichomonas vaginalis G3]|uniref:EF-hand domain-containing protein n=1 Tax=Trichomonas vaginalis (strain ATCC PRA-98 / G3) TaxID=412133 RepID=A2FTT6_TRIV3|nr:hypothetical protein TVAGG3_0060710 [Trichomonas vaginalis G3]EAX91693.1 hypothetical protein TVAG_092790 [Trichomonas vaginalis G3]KAI5541985.1 hypothetical protein TVAGG3_0060710 [Trichomonas vaginalis G3]|eukprot:XP_001304623.1 hypothetical protein [Trichomonas vaginalis G3]